ncbi:bifunctional hydroxymethylpyrimidine kinase/phosphomethylpyrimidine kinase [Peptococcaceae bacterium]|nr:bifunctional hydroxymethylpyrimidine kinase/phosphomethylpyrimidine kinase [Peptococcaceae bacterium]
MKAVLTIAGSDSGGGAGIQADLKTFSAHGVYGASVITAVTAQNTKGVYGIFEIEPSFVELQIKTVLEDIDIKAIKIGMLSNADIIQCVASTLKDKPSIPIVLDPVMVAKSKDILLKPEAIKVLIEYLLPITHLVTPNLYEASIIAEIEISTVSDMKKAAKIIKSMGASNVLIKGGHLQGDAIDILYTGDEFVEFTSPRLSNIHTHGTGCTFSASIASNLARGFDLKRSISKSKEYITNAIKNAFPIGKGISPVNHLYNQSFV